MDSESNNFFSDNFIDFLENKFMPYYFVWGALVLKGTEFTRMSNGVLENHQGFMKKKAHKDVLEHMHLISNYSTVTGIAREYLESLSLKATIRTIRKLSIGKL